MPTVTVEMTINAPAATTWAAVTDLAQYPKYMDNVHSVTVQHASAANTRTSQWSVTLKGSVLEWVEQDHTDDDARVMTFHQLDGDLEHFAGHWQVSETGPSSSAVALTIDFDIGIPLLADMLDPVAAKALRDNCQQMLTAIEARVARP